MFQSTSGGNGSGGGAGVGDAAFHNGFLHGDGAQLTRSRPRRGSRRRLHDQGAASDPRVSQQQEQHDSERPPRPCTDFDVAYFNSYAHLGIHEEMIKDRARTDTYKNAIFQHQDQIAGKVSI